MVLTFNKESVSQIIQRLMAFRIVIFLNVLLLIDCQDMLFINPQTSSDVSTITDYQVYYSNAFAITPTLGSSMTITFPSEYQGRLGVAACKVTIFNFFDGSTPTPTCSFSNLVLTISGLFTTGDTYAANSLLWMYIDGIRNPLTTKQTDNFTLGMTLDSGPYTTSVDGATCSAGTMTCSLSTDPASVNQKGKLIVSFTAPEFPIGSTIQIQTSAVYWEQSRPTTQSGAEIIQSSTLTCYQGTNSVAGIVCSYLVTGGTRYTISASNIVSSNFSSTTIVFSIATILSPPTTLPQGSFIIQSSNNNALMSTCTGISVVSTVGAISVGSYTTNKIIVNAAGMGTLTFVINSNLDQNDIFTVTFPSTMSLTSLTSVYINGEIVTSSLSISGHTITLTLTSTTIYAGSTITVDFANITNPPNELTTSAFQITTYRNGYKIETSTGSITYSAYRSAITSATLSSNSNQIGVVSNYTITFTLRQPLISSSAIVIALPSALQGKVLSCLPSPCSVISTMITFTGVSTAVNSVITLNLQSVTNPYNLGLTTSLTLYTLYYSSQPLSIVEYVNTGLTLTLVARASTNANANIIPSSYVVNNYPTTYTITITNLNPFFAYTYLSLYLPTEITIGGSITCQSGASVQSCNFDSTSNMLTFSPFTTSNTAGQLSSSPFLISNLINPPSTMSTSSFQVYFYNSNNQMVEYMTSGLTIQMTTPAKFSALSLITNNTVNSALTLLSVTFNVPSLTYQNNTVLVLTFPSIISLSNVLCAALSSNILAINQCLVNANTVKILMSYSSLSIFTSTKLSVGPYNNYPSLESYSIQVDLYGDTFQQSKLCSNINSPISLQNLQLNSIGISSYNFNNPSFLLTASNLLINFANASSTSFTSMTIKFPPDFGLTSAGCSAPSQVTCTLVAASNMFSLTTSSVFSFPFTVTLTNLITTAYSPSSYVFVQTFSSTGYQMDSNSDIYFATTCTLPCRTCQSTSQASTCLSCYSNSSLSQVSGAIYLNGTACSSHCGLGYYQDASLNCILCSTNCLTCSAYSTCLTCNSSYLFNSSCLTTCPFTYYGSNLLCFPCPTSLFCQSCTDNYHCSSCISGYYYYNQNCSTVCPGQITYPNSVNNTCDSCPQNCTNCQGNSTLVTCTVCNNGYVMDGTRCYLSCVTAGTFAVNGVCQGCSSSCLTCSGSYMNCTSCYSNSSIPYLQNNNCISTCPSGYYPDNSTFSCVKCTSPCEYCTDSSIHSCQTCVIGYFLYGNDCLSSCPTNYYNSSNSCLKCVSPCFTCTTELSCLSCTNNTYLYQSQCFQQCPAGLAVINGNQCLVCLATCKTCSTLTTCNSCYNSSYLYNGSCLNICPTTTFANTSTLICDSCIAPCLACSSLTTCISCADNSKFLVNGNCIACDSPCRSCSLSISNCTSCISTTSTPYYLSFSCLSICPSSYFSDNTTFQCSLCSSPCSSCYGSTNSSCGSCLTGYYLLQGICYTSCPATYYDNITICSQCQTPCLSCSINNSICTSCINTYYLKGSQCVSDCGTGMTVANNSVCSFCDSICKTCLTANSSACTSCYSTYYLQGSSCLSSCPNNYYGDGTSNQCLDCLSPCLTCQTSTICTSCRDPLLFLVSGSCLPCSDPCLTCSGIRTNCISCNITSLYPYLNSGNCIATCPVTYYPSINFTCLKCNSSCDTCLNESSTYCVSCISNYYLLQSKCLTNCYSGYFPNVTICSPCNSPCATCSDATTCLSCLTNYYLFGSSCVTNCSGGMSIINGNQCQYCAATCQTCSSSNSSACTSCYNSTYLYGVSCVTTCPSTFYSDSSSNRCMNCVGGCNTCQSATFCLSCLDSTLYLVNGTCVGCSSPCITCSGITTNCTSCAFSTTFPYLLNNICIASCPANYFNDISINACTKCTSPCQTCTSALTSDCVTCINGYLFHSGYCLPNCPAGYYSNGTACLGCVPPCQNCYDSANCISCTSGNYLMGSQCNASCATGMIVINNTYCQYCTGLCVTCLTANSSYCTSCAATQFLQWGSCINTCTSGYFGNSTSGYCEICQPPCGNCISPTICLSCFDATLFLLNNSCVSCLSPCMTCSITRNNCTSCDQSSSHPLFVSNLCLDACPSGYYSSLNTCYRCNAPCDTCLTVSNATCLTCLNGFVMLNSSGACLLNCPSGFYSNTIYCVVCTNNCSTCSSDSICLSCPNGLYLLGSTCTSSCPNGSISTVNATSGGICSYCNSPCTSCQTLNTSYCTSCPSNLYSSNGQCLTNCPNGFYGNSALWICSACVSPCSNCTSPTQCLSCLDTSQFLMNFMCVGCDIKCQTCSSNVNNCTSCNNSGAYPYLYGNTCLDGCPSTYYNDSSFVCKPCSSPCYTCSGSGNQSCLTCLVGYYQLGSLCYTICPGGYYSMGDQCLNCTVPCSTCTGSSNNSCTACQGGLYLLGSSCVNNCSGLATNGNTCVYCSSSCNTCLTNNNSFCTSCTSGLYLFSGNCLTNCSSGYYPESTSFVCLICINNCSICTSATACLTCADPNMFLINSQCVSCNSICLTCSGTINNCMSCNTSSSNPILFASTCISSCPSTYYNSTPTTCVQCMSPCSICSGAGTNACITCLSGYYLYSTTCYSVCPITTFKNLTDCSPCDATCYACQNSAFTCISCKAGFFLRGSTCVNNCSSGEVLINNTYCSVCTSNCLTCQSTNFSYCTGCSTGTYLSTGACLSACPTQYYGNSSSNMCVPCKLPCVTCSSDVICLSCNPSTPFLINYTCVSCSSPCLTCLGIQTNCTSCNTASSYPFLFGSNCIASCPSSYYNDGSFNCVRCNSPCDTCTSSSNRSCLTCLSGYSQLGTDCYLNCPNSYYSNGTYCLICDLSVCKTCTINNNTCLSCANGLYLSGSLCNSSCPTGMIIYNGSICETCTGGCLTCLTSNNSYCTSCYSGNYLYMGGCTPTCPNNFFAESSSGKCLACQSPCLQCLSIGSCLSCRNSLEYLQNFTCVSSCSYPLIGINNTCYQCSSQCLTCVQNVSTCLLCANSFYYFPATFSCSLYCSFYILRANQSNSGNNQCTQTCPSSSFTDSSSQYCQSCPIGCKTCISSSTCTQCSAGYSFYTYFCYSLCPIAAPYSINFTCASCNISNCQTCLNSTYCSTCQSTYLLFSAGSSSSCITSCPTGYTYNLTTATCVSNSAINQTSSISSKVISSSIPPYTILIATASLVFISFVIKFKYSQTSLSLILFVCVALGSSISLGNIIYMQAITSGISKEDFSSATVSTYVVVSSGALQVISSLACFLAILKIKDPALAQAFKAFPFTIATLMALSIIDSNLLLITISQLMGYECFTLKYSSDSMQKVFKFCLSVSIITKCLNIAYSGLQLNYFNAHSARLMAQTVGYPINNSYTNQLIVISSVAILIIIYLLYGMTQNDKIDNSKNQSNQSLIDDAHAFDKRNSSNSQLIFEVQSSDLIVDINSLKDEKDITLGSETKRFKKKSKVTPDQMLEKMNNGIEQEEPQKQQTQEQNPNKVTMQQLNDDKEKQPENQFDPEDINNVFYFQEEEMKEQNLNQEQKTENKQQKKQDNNNESSNREVHHDLNETPELSIIYNDHMQSPNEPSKLLENQIQAIQEAINQKTKTQIINIFTTEKNELNQDEKEKYSPSQLSKYQPNKKIEQQFANSYLDDANKFNEHNEVMKKSGQFINFEVDHRDYNEEQQVQEISFQKRQEFMTIQQPQSERFQEIQIQPQTIYKKSEWDDLIVDAPLQQPHPQPQPQPIKIEEEQEQQQEFHEETVPERVTPITPMKNSFFQAEDYDDLKPSQGLKNKHKSHKKKPDIPLPKNEIQKQIMNIYQKKEKKQLPPRKKRYPDMPSQSKMTNEVRQVRYSIEESDFIEEKPTFKPIFSGEIKRDMPSRYNQSRASNQLLYDEQQPEKPSVRLRKSSFKKIGEMVIEQPQSSGRK